MLFKLSNKKQNRTTHCGVLEFVADEGKIYIPYWMMQNLMLDEGGLIQVAYFSGMISLLRYTLNERDAPDIRLAGYPTIFVIRYPAETGYG